MSEPDSTDPTRAGTRVREARKGRLLSQEQLALAAGVSVSSVARLERGDLVSPETLKSVCAVLDLDAVGLYAAAPSAPAVPAPGAAGTPVPARSRWPARLARFGVVAAVGGFLALFGIEMGLQASHVTEAPRIEALHASMYSIAAFRRAKELNRAAATYSALLPADDPDRAWQPWDQDRPMKWLSCGTKASGVGAALVTGNALDLFGLADCRDVGIAQVVVRRDAEETEALLGPMPRAAWRDLAGLLTSDPSVAVSVLVSERADLPGPDPDWLDPRRRTLPEGAEGPAYLRVRLARAAR